jgi:hypothetical protein
VDCCPYTPMSSVRVCVSALVLSLFALAARADSITVNGITFTGTVTAITATASTATLEVQCTDLSICGGWYLGDVTLKGFSYTGTPTLASAPSGYVLVPGGQNNSAVSTGGGCNGTQVGSALCWDASLPLTTVLGSSPIYFSANITGGSVGTLAVQATGYNNPQGSQLGGDKMFAVSTPFQGVPEPSSLALLFSGLAGFLLICVFRNRP